MYLYYNDLEPTKNTSKNAEEPSASEIIEQKKASLVMEQRIEELRELNRLGFEATRVGFVFPGVKVDFNKTLKKKDSEKEPLLWIADFTSDGVMTLVFNQEMLVPDEIDQAIYRAIFRLFFKIKDRIVTTKFLTNKQVKELNQTRKLEGSKEEPINVHVTLHNATNI